MSKYGLNKEKLESKITNVEYQRFGATGTLCVITLANGYTVIGESGCIDPSIFNEAMGKEIAYANAFEKLWGILGYAEKQRWYEETQLSWEDRVKQELSELDEKRTKLAEWLNKGKPEHFSDKQWELLMTQNEAMSVYGRILQDRLAEAK